ncbi:MAG: carboxypeptidase regulatory-like domain-containing protein [Ktedonobacterales bacterium]|nr:carboxypeptidase regulatory-like domain-containing protein [Ktedonobacterales bacterium]
MQRCSYCQFPCPDAAQICGWCTHSLHDATREATSPYRVTATLPAAPPPRVVPRDLATLVAEHTRTASVPLTGPARTDTPSANAPTQAAYPLWSAPMGYTPLTGAYHTGLVAGVPPPNFPPVPVARWWLAIPPLTLLLAWLMAQGTSQWDVALAGAGRALFAGSVTLVGVAAWLYQRQSRRATMPPLTIAGIFFALWCLTGALAQPALAMQAHTLEARGNYAGAAQLYGRAGDQSAALHARLEWGQMLTDQGNFTAAQAQLGPVLATATGSLSTAARGAMGHLLWRWGQALFATGDLAGTRSKWGQAATLAAGTADGDAAKAALAVPQTVTGHLIWHGEPLPGERVALVNAWTFSPEFHILQVTGERLPATSGDDGRFSITGVRPGVTYTLIWEGQYGDVTGVDAAGQPTTTITLQPLAGGDLGTIAIDR